MRRAAANESFDSKRLPLVFRAASPRIQGPRVFSSRRPVASDRRGESNIRRARNGAALAAYNIGRAQSTASSSTSNSSVALGGITSPAPQAP
ncbi:MAG: hypothetical protein BroJett031_16470 [Betaproteobacteria bacterium]|nr:MAG: hypothetical protein BroJett031_16470 [Betaproteobacteria bacterium]